MTSTHHFTVGNLNAAIIADYTDTLTRENVMRMFPTLPADILNDYLRANPVPHVSRNVLYIEDEGQRILIDTGEGLLRLDKAGRLHQNLQTLGIDAATIDKVFITHLHGDHIGGLLDADQRPAFPNAEILIAQAEFKATFNNPETPAEKSAQLEQFFAPYNGKTRQLGADEQLSPHIKTVLMSGHTVGHTGILIESGNAKLLHVVDAMHLTFQLNHPEQSPRFDADPLQAAQTRQALIPQAADQTLQVLAYHFPFPGLGKITRENDQFVWVSS